ncbi:hypothetical protein CHITON_1591 [Thermococcus chitonophagus]|nr:hypothetical protein CHITON_1591 [Thermococcus chitonophagus]
MEANYYAADGDSGAPVFYSYRNVAAELYGIHVGVTKTGSSIYSPIDGIEKDLRITLDITGG